MRQFAGFGQLAHQGQGLLRHAEAQWRIACGETGDAQDPQRIFGESRGNVAQYARGKIPLTAVGVEQPTLIVLGHGVDGQVAADQVLFQGDVGAGMKGETAVAAPALAFGAGQGIFLPALRVEEYREVLADRPIAEREHLLGIGADHHPVDIGDRSPEQAVAHGAADFVDLHV